MLNKCFCATCIGVEAVVVTVEVDLSVGVGIHLVGLPDSAVRESLLRVITALTSYGFRIPGRKLVVNLAPADIRKEGSAYDLAIAIGLLCSLVLDYFLYLAKITVPAFTNKFIAVMAVASVVACLVYFLLGFVLIKISPKGSKLESIFPKKN